MLERIHYEIGSLLTCPECAHEWSAGDAEEAGELAIRDAVGNALADGDTVAVIKSLEVGSPSHSRRAPRSATSASFRRWATTTSTAR